MSTSNNSKTIMSPFLRWMFAALTLASLSLVACGRANDKKQLNGTAYGAGVYSATCSNGQDAVGMIFDGGNSTNFRTQVAAYVSSWMDPNSLGMIDGGQNSTQTGVDFRGKFRFDGSGQVVRQDTGVIITIIDSYSAQGQPAIAPADYTQKVVAGSINTGSRTFEVTMQDQYGYVKFTGQFDNNFAWGQVQFANSRSVNNMYQPQSGTLGAFKIAKCGLLD